MLSSGNSETLLIIFPLAAAIFLLLWLITLMLLLRKTRETQRDALARQQERTELQQATLAAEQQRQEVAELRQLLVEESQQTRQWQDAHHQLDLQLAAAQAAAKSEAQAAGNQAQATRKQVEQLEQALAELRTREKRQLEERSETAKEFAPVAARVNELRQQLTDLQKSNAELSGKLQQQLVEGRSATERIVTSTTVLEQALKNTRQVGVWGEARLIDLLQTSGLILNQDFQVQPSLRSEGEEGKVVSQRPDVILNLPGGRRIALDAKVSMEKFLEAQQLASQEGADSKEVQRLLKEHARTIREHVKTLGSRAYHQGLGTASPDITVMFLPNEALLRSAIEIDPDLLSYAFAQRVAPSTPMSLWPTLQMISYVNQQEQLSRKAQEIVDLGSTLTERLATVVNHWDQLGKTLGQALQQYNKSVSSLNTRLLPAARRVAGKAEDSSWAEIGERSHEPPKQIALEQLEELTPKPKAD